MHLYNEVENERVRVEIGKLAANAADVPEQESCTSPHDSRQRIY